MWRENCFIFPNLFLCQHQSKYMYKRLLIEKNQNELRNLSSDFKIVLSRGWLPHRKYPMRRIYLLISTRQQPMNSLIRRSISITNISRRQMMARLVVQTRMIINSRRQSIRMATVCSPKTPIERLWNDIRRLRMSKTRTMIHSVVLSFIEYVHRSTRAELIRRSLATRSNRFGQVTFQVNHFRSTIRKLITSKVSCHRSNCPSPVCPVGLVRAPSRNGKRNYVNGYCVNKQRSFFTRKREQTNTKKMIYSLYITN